MTQLVIHRTGASRADAPLSPPVTGTPHRIRSYDGTELAALVAGDGPPLVLAHGSLVSSASWALMWRPLLDAGYRLIAYDLRGHGLSTLGTDGFGTGPYGRDLAAVLEHFDVRDGVIVAHSAGAIGTLALAAHAPDTLAGRIRALVLASASPRGIGDTVPNRLLAPILFSDVIVRILRRPRSGRSFARTLFGDHPDPDQVEFTRQLLAATPDASKIQAPKAVLNYDLTGRLAGVQMPTLLLHGERDRSVTADHVNLLRRELPHAPLTRYERAGHMLVLERASRFAQDVDGFARRVLAGARDP